MRLSFPSDKQFCVPFVIGNGPSDVGPRLGGTAPFGVVPRRRVPDTQYYLTIPLSEDSEIELSVFLSFKCQSPTFERFWSRKMILERNELVEVVVHPKSRRGSSREFVSDLSAHPLIVQPGRRDLHPGSGTENDGGQKLGGTPAVDFPRPELDAAIRDAFAAGYRQVLQIGSPKYEDANVCGSLPFGQGTFHLFGKQPFAREEDWMWFYEL